MANETVGEDEDDERDEEECEAEVDCVDCLAIVVHPVREVGGAGVDCNPLTCQ